MYVLIKETFPTARKPHKCIWCGEPIMQGVKHRHEISKYDELQDFRWHLECNAAAGDYFAKYGEDEFCPYENDRPVETKP